MLAFLSRLAGTGSIPTVLTYQAAVIHPTDTMAPRMDNSSRIIVFCHPVLGSVMDGVEHELLTKFLKIKSPTIQGTEFVDALSSSLISMRGYIR